MNSDPSRNRSAAAGRPSEDMDAIRLEGNRLANRTFLLGNERGFVLYLPAEQNIRDRTLLPIKWFGVSEFGRKYLEAVVVYVTVNGRRTKLDRSNQTAFVLHLDRAVRTFEVEGCRVLQSLFVPNDVHAFVMSLEADRSTELAVQPEFDMRYYQAFNQDFGSYAADIASLGRADVLHVYNRIQGPSPTVGEMQFFCTVRALEDVCIEMLPATERLRHKVYLKDERRQKLIQSAYAETRERAPDEAPIWDMYDTCVYAPTEISGSSPLTLIFSFGDLPGESEGGIEEVSRNLPALQKQKAEVVTSRSQDANLETGRLEIDRAYRHVLARFNEALVARNVKLHTNQQEIDHFYAIFAGNKYFLDAWKRDENISLIALLLTGEYETVCAILDETWQHQDPRTGRLPHIIRLGEPLVYYSSDGTLWALRRLYQYTQITGDQSLLQDKYPMVEHFFAASMRFVQRGLLPSGGIIDKAYLWETWEDTPYTPRDGYPVEIELLWLTALADFQPVVAQHNPQLASTMAATLEEGRETFKLFYLDGYLADSLRYDWQPRRILTPNGYVAFSLGYPLPDELKHSMVLLGREQLAGKVGIRSLAPRDWASVLSPAFLADPHNIRHGNMASVGIYNYHRGIEWLWLNQFFVEAELLCGDTDSAYWTYTHGQVHTALGDAGIGGLSELHDAHGSLGADFQAWSMASFLASLHAFSGVCIDALTRRIEVRPSLPACWPSLRCRWRVAQTRFDVSCSPGTPGSHRVEVQTVEDAPEGYTLCLGARLPAAARLRAVILNGEPLPSDRLQIIPGCAPDVAAEVWIETVLATHTSVEFQSD